MAKQTFPNQLVNTNLDPLDGLTGPWETLDELDLWLKNTRKISAGLAALKKYHTFFVGKNGVYTEYEGNETNSPTVKKFGIDDRSIEAVKIKLGAIGTDELADEAVTEAKLSLELAEEINGKVDSETGKGLSSNDYSNEDKSKLTLLPTSNEISTSLGLKADKQSPSFIGIPTAPTAAASTNTTQIATTEFVTRAVTTETTARTNAISAESTARSTADTKLTNDLAIEVTARENAVNNLNEAIASGVGTTEAIIQPAMTSSETSTTNGVSAKGIADFVAEQKALTDAQVTQLSTKDGELEDSLTNTNNAVTSIVVFDRAGVVAAFDKLEEILRKAVFVDDEESAITAFKALVTAIKSEHTVITSIATPSISITDGSMTITCSTAGTTIYYTTDGSTPTTSSTRYISQVTLSQSCTIKAIAIKGSEASRVKVAVYSKPSATLITFEDSSVKALLVANVDTDGDGEISYDEASAVTTMKFFKQTAIVKFNEFQHFTGIGKVEANSFDNCTSLTSIVLPSNVTAVEANAFTGCSALATCNLPNSITSIGNYAFSSCSSLVINSLPTSLATIGYKAFNGCSNVKFSSFPAGVTSLGVECFSGCVKVEFSSLPSSLTTIGNKVFYSCAKLKLTSLPSGLTSIGEYAFAGCQEMPLASLPSGLTTIGQGAFFQCYEATISSLPNTITSIGAKAFRGCSKLAITTIPTEISSIPNECFYGCTSLSVLEIPGNITSIGDSAFNTCSGLTKVKFTGSTLPALGTNVFSIAPNLYIPNDIYDAGSWTSVQGWSAISSSKVKPIREF